MNNIFLLKVVTYAAILIILLYGVVSFYRLKQSTIYLLLWPISVLGILFYSDFYGMFLRLFPESSFGSDFQKIISACFFVFALFTLVIHQYYIYYYLHELEELPEKWAPKYPGFYDKAIDKTLRAIVFIVLLAVIGKIPGIDNIIDSICTGNGCTIEENRIVLSSATLFSILVIYDIIAGIMCKKFRDKEYLNMTLGDGIAMSFWCLIAWSVLVEKSKGMNAVFAIFPILAGFIYMTVCTRRIIGTMRSGKVK